MKCREEFSAAKLCIYITVWFKIEVAKTFIARNFLGIILKTTNENKCVLEIYCAGFKSHRLGDELCAVQIQLLGTRFEPSNW